ncbi:xaa-Arg dipeptidase-like [Amblyomma americanum]
MLTIHGVITNGGVVASVVPDEAELYYYYRAPNAIELEQLRRLLDNCFQGAAVSTGCALDLDWQGGYEPLLSNAPLADAFRRLTAALGLGLDEPRRGLRKVVFMASSDIGHVSHRVPTIQPTFTICSAPNHTPEFAAAAAHMDAQAPTLLMTKAVAFTGLDLFRDPGLLPEVRKNFAENRAPSSTN